MKLKISLPLALALACCLAVAATAARWAYAQAIPLPAARPLIGSEERSLPQPERQLAGVRLGRPFQSVLLIYGPPDTIETVQMQIQTDQLPGVAGAGVAGPAGFGGAAQPPGFGGGGGIYGQGGGGGGGAPGGLPPGVDPVQAEILGLTAASQAGGGGGIYGQGGGGGIYGGAGGPMAAVGGGSGGALPEFSSAVRWIYNRGPERKVRIEFLINEDGRVAQISVAAPAEVRYTEARTSRGVMLGTRYDTVLNRYDFPERNRVIPPTYRFTEAYYTTNYHVAFAFDNANAQKVVRITIALAD